MEIAFRMRRLEREFNDETRLVRAYGQRRANLIKIRMAILIGANNLSQVPATRPFRLHQLSGNRKGQFAIDLDHPFRLIFQPNHNPVPQLPDGGIDIQKVTDIVILEVKDYH